MTDTTDSRIWLITGCSSGFGRALVTAALDAGQRVVATARDVSTIADLELDGRCRTLTLDVTDTDTFPRFVSNATAAFGSIDVLVNNAGYGLLGAVEECSDDQTRRAFETNFFGPLNLTRALLPQMRAARRGHIVNISAAAAVSNYAGFGVYGGAKAALELTSESLRAELQPLGIKVTLVEPGPFRTAFIARGMEKGAVEIDDYNASARKFGRLLASMDGKQPGDPARAASAIVHTVLSDDAPLRLPLGKYMIRKLRDKAATLVREADKWEALASDTDFAK
ncbi:MAG TPA: oxidoreductase [Gemmatimonas sp.]|nr:oxidoreductase [Gemmatimonas sp.]